MDWQTIAVALIVAAAALYVAARAARRLRAIAGRPGGGAPSACATGCGKCGDEEAEAPRSDLVSIRRAADRRSRKAY